MSLRGVTHAADSGSGHSPTNSVAGRSLDSDSHMGRMNVSAATVRAREDDDRFADGVDRYGSASAKKFFKDYEEKDQEQLLR